MGSISCEQYLRSGVSIPIDDDERRFRLTHTRSADKSSPSEYLTNDILFLDILYEKRKCVHPTKQAFTKNFWAFYYWCETREESAMMAPRSGEEFSLYLWHSILTAQWMFVHAWLLHSDVFGAGDGLGVVGKTPFFVVWAASWVADQMWHVSLNSDNISFVNQPLAKRLYS